MATGSMQAAYGYRSSFLHPHQALLLRSGGSPLSAVFKEACVNLKKQLLTSIAISRKAEVAVEPAKCAVRFRPCIDIHKASIHLEGQKNQHIPTIGATIVIGGLQVGGGINPGNAWTYLEAGASHVIVTSYVFNDGKMDLERLKALVRVVGKERLVLDLSCRKKVTDQSIPSNPSNMVSKTLASGELCPSCEGALREVFVSIEVTRNGSAIAFGSRSKNTSS